MHRIETHLADLLSLRRRESPGVDIGLSKALKRIVETINVAVGPLDALEQDVQGALSQQVALIEGDVIGDQLDDAGGELDGLERTLELRASVLEELSELLELPIGDVGHQPGRRSERELLYRGKELGDEFFVVRQQEGDRPAAELGVVPVANQLLGSFLVAQLDKSTVGRLARLEVNRDVNGLRNLLEVWKKRVRLGRPLEDVAVGSDPGNVVDADHRDELCMLGKKLCIASDEL